MTVSGLGSGLGGAVVVASESTYGTWVTPTSAKEIRSAKFQARPHFIQGTGLASGRNIDPGARRVNTWTDAGGTIELEFLDQGMSFFVANAMNSNATLTQIGTTTAYQLNASYGTSLSSFSMQSQVPTTDGVINPYNFHGCMISKTTWSCERAGFLMAALDVDSQYVEQTESAVSTSFTPGAHAFSGANMILRAGAFGSEVALDGIKKFSMTLEDSMAYGRIYMGNAYKEIPVFSGISKITGQIDLDFVPTNKSVLWDIFAGANGPDTAVPSLVATFTGASIGSSGHVNQVKLNPTDVFIDSGGTPELAGPEVVTASLNFTSLLDANNDNPFTVQLITPDTTLT